MNVPTLAQPLAQREREMVVGAFLDVTHNTWVAWVQTTGDDEIPDELHAHVVSILTSLAAAAQVRGDDVADAYQPYLQALALLSDSALVWLVEQTGTNPLKP